MTTAPVHSKLAPSKAYSWVPCTASVGFIAAHPELPKDTSKYADEGTEAHLVLTKRLTTDPNYPAANAEMDGIIKGLIKFIQDRFEEGDLLYVDEKVSLFYYTLDKGTLDVALIGRKRSLFIDLKYGVGVGVYAEENPQLAIYAESKLRMLEECNPDWRDRGRDSPIHLVIYQPRDRNDPTVAREWVVSRIELNRFCQPIQQAADLILSGGPTEFRPGDACQFCRAKGICTAYASQGLAPLVADADVPAVIEALPNFDLSPALTREQRQRVLQSKKTLIEWLEAVENQEVAELLAGATPRDFKLVEGKTNRQWRDEKAVARLLLTQLEHDQIYPPIPPEIVSPAQSEKLLKGKLVPTTFKAEFSALTQKPVGKPTLVPISDPRPALLLNPSDGLSVIEDPRDMI